MAAGMTARRERLAGRVVEACGSYDGVIDSQMGPASSALWCSYDIAPPV